MSRVRGGKVWNGVSDGVLAPPLGRQRAWERVFSTLVKPEAPIRGVSRHHT